MDINLAFVDAFRAERVANGAAPKTVHNDTVTIRQVVKFAVRRVQWNRRLRGQLPAGDSSVSPASAGAGPNSTPGASPTW